MAVLDDYTRAATLVRVIDGDTAVMDVDLGFHVRVRMSCRLAGINAAEHDEPGGPEARTALATILAGRTVSVASVRVDKYAGRFDALVFATDPAGTPDCRVWHVNRWMVEQGYAVEWDGTGPKPAVPWPPVPPAGTDVPPVGTVTSTPRRPGPELRDPSEVEVTG